MSINGIGTSDHSTSWRKSKIQQDSNIPGTDFASRMADINVARANSQTSNRINVKRAITEAAFGRDNYVNGTADIRAAGVYSKESISAAQEWDLPLETERYKIEDASYIEGAPAYSITDKETGRSLYMREDQLVIQRDTKTGLEFVINMDQPFSCNVQVTGELKGLLNDIMTKRGLPLKETPLQGGLTVHQDPKTGLRYLAIQGNEAKGMSVIITSKKDWETLEKLADEFQQYEVCSNRSIAGLYALLEISGNLKREKDGMTYLTPDGISYIPYDEKNKDKAWHIILPNSDYSAARKYLASGIDVSSDKAWMRKFRNARLLDKDTASLNRHSQSVLPRNEANTLSGAQETDTHSEIIVRPDGSRVLMITVEIGGMQTAMSLQISEPTDLQNDILKQEIDSSKASVSATSLTVDEISGSVSEG